uniref:Uncharacterized protein n=1 Tax=Panagrolaimus sp. PS1159 TaxID=55785 RepID=A0AC35FVU9_9BILA
MPKRPIKRGKSSEASPAEDSRSAPPPSGNRRQDILVPEDNLGIEQRALILPSAREGDDGFTSDDDDDFIDMERIDLAAQRQEIMVVDRAEKRRREAEVKEYMRCHLQRIRHKNDNVHKLHVFAIVANFTKRMSTCVKLAKSLKSNIFPVPSPGQDLISYLKSLGTKSWFKLKKFESFTTLSSKDINDFYSVERMRLVAACVCETELDAAVATVINLCALGFTVRLVYAFKAVAKGETNVHITEEMMDSFVKNGYRFPENFSIKGRRTEAAEKKLKIGVYDKKRGKGKAAAQKKVESSESESEMEADPTSNEDEDFENEDEIESVKKKKPKIEKKKKPVKSLKKATKPSTSKKSVEPMDTSESVQPFEKIKAKSYYFVEVWDENEMMWIDFDPLKGIVDDADSITKNLDKELEYVFAFDSDGGFRDVSIKYIKNFVMPERRQSRIDESYIYQLMYRKPIRAQLQRNLLEDELIYAKLLSMPLPRTKGGYKNHFFYALEEHLKVKEALYPRDATPVDEHNIFDVHSRKNVGMLDIDLRWRRKGYQVKEGEEPYKLIAGRARGKKEAPQQKLFGPWQLERTPAPELDEDGSIPVNANGNVYLYKSWMTPKECIHLKVNGHGEEIAKLADVENVQAIVAWTFKKAKYFPVMYGVVVKKEDLPAILMAKKEFYAKGLHKKSEKRIRKTILPFVRRDKARQAFYKSFYRTIGSVAKNDLEYLQFDFNIPDDFSSLKVDAFVNGMPLTQYENGLSEHIIESVDRYKKLQAEQERLAPKKVVIKPKTSPELIVKAKSTIKSTVVDKSNGNVELKSKAVDVEKTDLVSSNRRVTRSSTRASIAATLPPITRKPLAPTQQENIYDESESLSETSESDEEYPRQNSVPPPDTPSRSELKKKQAKRGKGRSRGGRKRL